MPLELELCDWCGERDDPCYGRTTCGENFLMLGQRHAIDVRSLCQECGFVLSFVIDGGVFEATTECLPLCGASSIGSNCMASHEESCEECLYEADEDYPGMHDYSYKPFPIFHGTGPRFYGVELEVDDGVEVIEAVESVLKYSDMEQLFYVKADGSLNNGFEIVTNPCTLRYHTTNFPWRKVMESACRNNFKSHQTATCGLHIHVSRKALGATATHQDMTLSNLILLYWRHWEQIRKFSRRKFDEIDTWCQPNYRQELNENVSEEALMLAKARGKYAAINSDNRATIEFRVFKGSLVYETVIAALQFTDVLIDLALTRKIEWIVESKWEDIVDACRGKELMEYLKNKGLLRGTVVTEEKKDEVVIPHRDNCGICNPILELHSILCTRSELCQYELCSVCVERRMNEALHTV